MTRSIMFAILFSVAACAASDPEAGGMPQPQASYCVDLAYFSAPGCFDFIGPTSPGHAGVENAVVQPESGNFQPGKGTYEITIDASRYTSDTASAVTHVITNALGISHAQWHAEYFWDTQTEMLASDPGAVVVIVPFDDVVAGSSVALDGDLRVALFVKGIKHIVGNTVEMSWEPSAAAVSGTVTFTNGELVPGSSLTASVVGDFGPIEFTAW